ncbi:MAG: cytochrome c oxidase assembly protein, partial [Kiloniellales bacterium]|nr:cytochrome c oxidase assembly protein [Kiloniellales bacterium]
DRVMHIRFNADVIGGLPWSFQPAQREVSVNVGESGLAFYKAKNLSKKAVTGVAVFNVTPLKAGQYFQKIQCFCFDEQTLAGGQQVDMPVSYFVDPAINDDPNLDDVRTITLSYTFFSVEEDNGEEQEEELSALPGNGEGEAVKQASLD